MFYICTSTTTVIVLIKWTKLQVISKSSSWSFLSSSYLHRRYNNILKYCSLALCESWKVKPLLLYGGCVSKSLGIHDRVSKVEESDSLVQGSDTYSAPKSVLCIVDTRTPIKIPSPYKTEVD